MQPIFEKIKARIESAGEIAIITHVDPDGDALGSLAAAGVALRQWHKQITFLCDNRASKRFDFLPRIDEIKNYPEGETVYDLVIALDCGDELRMGNVFARLPEPKPFLINIDHHITNTQFGDINYVDGTAVSTTEILFTLFKELGFTFTTELSLSLLTGLITDTLGFRTSNVTGRTLKIGGELVDAGADLSLVTMQTLNLKPLSTLNLWEVGLKNMQLSQGLVWTTINDVERRASGHLSSSTAGLVNFLSDLDQAAMSAVLLEMGDGSIRVGFRSRPPYNVAELAMNLGGGGHAQAAGCTLDGPLIEAESLVVELSKQTIERQQAMLFGKNGHN